MTDLERNKLEDMQIIIESGSPKNTMEGEFEVHMPTEQHIHLDGLRLVTLNFYKEEFLCSSHENFSSTEGGKDYSNEAYELLASGG